MAIEKISHLFRKKERDLYSFSTAPQEIRQEFAPQEIADAIERPTVENALHNKFERIKECLFEGEEDTELITKLNIEEPIATIQEKDIKIYQPPAILDELLTNILSEEYGVNYRHPLLSPESTYEYVILEYPTYHNTKKDQIFVVEKRIPVFRKSIDYVEREVFFKGKIKDKLT